MVRTITEIMGELMADTTAQDPSLCDWSLHSMNRKTNIPIAIQLQKIETLNYALANAQNPNTATGSELDDIVRDRGLTRYIGAKATGIVNFVRVTIAPIDIVIPAGTEVSAPSYDALGAVSFQTTATVTLASGNSSVAANVVAALPGTRSNVRASAVRDMPGGISGVDYVTNPLPFTGGTDTESDTDLRERYIYTVSEPGKATITTIKEHLEALTNDDGEDIVAEAKVSSLGLGDVEIVVDVSDVATNEDIVSQGIIDNLAVGPTACGCLAAHLDALENIGDLGDTAGGRLWARASCHVNSEDTFAVNYINQDGDAHEATFVIPTGTVKGKAILGTLAEVTDEVVSVPDVPTYTGNFSYDLLIGYGDYPYLFLLPEKVAIDVTLTYTPTDTPEADLDELIQASIETFLDDFMIGEELQFSDLYDSARYQYIKGGTWGARFEGIDSIDSLSATDGSTTIDTLGEKIVIEQDSRVDPGDVSATITT